MTDKIHHYEVSVIWTGNKGNGTQTYQGYERTLEIVAPGKPAIPGTSDPALRGDPKRWSPEELLVASVSACHKLWYLALCAQDGVVVIAYEDNAEGFLAEEPCGSGQFTSIILRPHITISAQSSEVKALSIHQTAHKMCFIARSMNFPLSIEPVIIKGAVKLRQEFGSSRMARTA